MPAFTPIAPDIFLWSDTCNVFVVRDGDAALLIDLGDGSACRVPGVFRFGARKRRVPRATPWILPSRSGIIMARGGSCLLAKKRWLDEMGGWVWAPPRTRRSASVFSLVPLVMSSP